MDKQFKYAERKKIPYVVIIGEREVQEKNCTLKNLASGKQQVLTHQELLKFPFE